ncbi:MAG: glycoside hydrolase family 13 protein [Jatrophihabitans sp.]|nr:MAG: glycoside hydrolase family 13 protein [Jatrophihabitans sp.]
MSTRPGRVAAVRESGAGRRPAAWWADAVFYQIYPRSFADSNGDGDGDLAGVTSRLDHLVRLGVDALWLSPFYRSPMADGGYDVADPCDVDPRFGTLEDFDALVAAAHERGIRVTVDVVPNHFSEQHPWFGEALQAGPGSPERDRFVFRAGRGPGGDEPPNNWPSVFGGPAWTRVPGAGDAAGRRQWYLHLFAREQPDLNWDNPQVRAEFDRILRFWLDRGVDGFRVDVAHGMAKEPGLPDLDLSVVPGPDAGIVMPARADLRWDRDGLHEYLRGFRRVLDSYPGDRMAVGEAWVPDAERLARYVRPDELNLSFNFELTQASWDAADLRAAIERSLAAMAGVGAPCTWVLANHDVERTATRLGSGATGRARARAAALLQLALPGAAYLYNGDELALPNVDVPDEALRDPSWERSGHADRGRDGERVPMPWSGSAPPYGFSTTPDTWLPMPDGWASLTVAAQRADPASTLHLYRAALRLRHRFRGGPFAWLDAPPGCLAFSRGTVEVLVNAGAGAVPMPAGAVLLASGPLGDGVQGGGVLPPDTTVWTRRAGPRRR